MKRAFLEGFVPLVPVSIINIVGTLLPEINAGALVLAEAMTACEFQIERIAMMDNLSAEDAEHAQTAIKAYNVLKHLDLEKSVSPYIIA